MRRKTIIRLYVFALLSLGGTVLTVLIFALIIRPLVPVTNNFVIPTLITLVQYGLMIAFLLAAFVLASISWIGALVRQGQQQQWGWFVCTLLFGGIVLLIYLIAVPESSPQLPVPGYGQVYQYQPPMYYPPNQPFYPSSSNDPRP